MKVSQDEINSILWKACDTFRGTVDPAQYKDYILVMLFVKYLSGVWQDHYDELKAEFGDDEERIQRRLKRDRFQLPKDCSFAELYEKRKAANLGEVINHALEEIEEAGRRLSKHRLQLRSESGADQRTKRSTEVFAGKLS